MKKRIGLLFCIFILVFSCKNNMQQNTGKGNKQPEIPKPAVKPKLIKLEVINAADNSKLFSASNFDSNEINAGMHEVESVKIKAEAESGTSIIFTPALKGADSDEFKLDIIGGNFLNIVLDKNGTQNVYILKIIRKKMNTEPPRKIKTLKADFGWTPLLSNAVQAVKDGTDDKVFTLQLDHNKAGHQYAIFAEGEDSEDIIVLAGKTEKFKADNKAIPCGKLPEAGKSSTLEFYLFQKDIDTSNLGLGTKYTLKITVAKEPNTKITSIKFNGKDGIINGNAVTCETEFKIDTIIKTDVVCEDSTSSAIINGGSEVKITAAGASFKITVTPAEGEIYKSIYNVTLKAETENTKRVTGIKYDTNSPQDENSLTETANRGADNICLVSHDGNNHFFFVPIISEGTVTKVQIKTKNSSVFSDLQTFSSSGCYYILKRDTFNLTSGITIKVIFSDGKTDEFVIKKN